MATNGRSQTGQPLRQVESWPVVRAVVPDVQYRLHTGGTGFLQCLLRRQRFAQVQEVRVRIDQATGSGFSMRGNSTPPRVVCVRGASLPHSRAVAQGIFGSALTWAPIFPAVSGKKGEIK
jgi:hypothetical protein